MTDTSAEAVDVMCVRLVHPEGAFRPTISSARKAGEMLRVLAAERDALAARLAEAEWQRDAAVVALKKLDRRMDNLDTWNTGVHDIVAPALASIKETRDDT